MAKAVVGAGTEVTVLASESRVAGTHTIVAVLVVEAAALTPTKGAVSAHVSTVTDASPVDALAVSGTLIGACADRAVSAGVTELTVASSIVADTLVGAVVGAGSERAIITRPSSIADTNSHVDTGTGTRA